MYVCMCVCVHVFISNTKLLELQKLKLPACEIAMVVSIEHVRVYFRVVHHVIIICEVE